jgi:hypothetical protein
MEFLPGSGLRVKDKMDALRELMWFDMDQPLVPITNEPHLYVSEKAQQVIWALNTWTGLDGEKGACKDFIDLLGFVACDEACQFVDAKASACWVHPGR